jgi:hypothetical protein
MLGSPALSSAILALAVAANVSAQQAASHKVFPLRPIPSEQWIEVLVGDPSKPGVPFVLRIHNDAGYVCPPHTHPTDENIVVVQGSWGVGMGSRIALSTVELLEVGAYGLVPSKMAHYCRSKTETILQVHGVGPFSIDLVDPGYEMTAAGAGVMGGSPVGSRSPSAESVSSCFKLRMGDRVRGALGDGTVVGAQCFPTNQFTQYWIQRANGERFWATLEALKKL